MAYKLATAFIDIVTRGIGAFNQALGGIAGRLSALGGTLAGSFGVPLGIGAAIAAATQYIHMAESAIDTEMRLRSILKATGEAAGFNAKQILAMVDSLKKVTVFGGGNLTAAATNLLKFDKISGDVFKRALRQSTDLAASGFGTVERAAQALGRALQDPVRGSNALRAAGVVLDKQQKKNLEKMIKQGQILKAQTFLLDMVASKTADAAETDAKSPSGQWKQVKKAISDVGEEIGKRLLPMATKIAKVVLDISNGVLSLVNTFSLINDATGGWLVTFGIVVGVISAIVAVAAVLAPIFVTIGGAIMSVVAAIGVWPAILVGVLAVAAAIGAAFVDWGAVLKWVGDTLYDLSLWAVVFVQNWRDAIPAVIAGAKFLAMYMLELYRNNATYIWGYFAGRGMRAIADLAVWIADVLYRAFTGLASALVSLFASIPELIAAAISGTPGALEEMGKSLLAGFETAFNEAVFQIKRAEEGFEDGFNKTMKGLKLDPSDANKKRLEEFNTLFAKLSKAKEELEAKRGEMFNLPDLGAGKANKKDDANKKLAGQLELPSGLTGLTEAWSQLQEAMLKKDDPNEKMAEGIENMEGLNEDMLNEMVMLNRDGLKLKDVAVA